MSKPNDLVQGTLDLLLLKILALEPLHGWAISLRLKSVSGDVLQVSEGSLYPALHKLEQEGWITAEWKQTENNRRAKFYSLTRLGRKQLESEAANWHRLSSAISRVVRPIAARRSTSTSRRERPPGPRVRGAGVVARWWPAAVSTASTTACSNTPREANWRSSVEAASAENAARSLRSVVSPT